jgi:NTP pyrophosphatase (non-canonical NTP hydrolase)
MNRSDIMAAIFLERYRQDAIHPNNKPNEYFPILIEEVGEIGTAIQNKDVNNLKEEIIHVAAVCVRWLENIEDN